MILEIYYVDSALSISIITKFNKLL